MEKTEEEERVKGFAKIALLVELGLPSEAAAKAFLAGIRSRTAATEMAPFIDSGTSISAVRTSLLDPGIVAQLQAAVSPATFEWIQMLTKEHVTNKIRVPRIQHFTCPPAEGQPELHARSVGNRIFLCSVDGTFKTEVLSTNELPFAEVINDPNFIFRRFEDAFYLMYRDPRFETPWF